MVDGKHGKYAVATTGAFRNVSAAGTVTFSLDMSKEEKDRVWQEDDIPAKGIQVILWDLRLKRAGMHWTVRGANAILALRCCRLNGRF